MKRFFLALMVALTLWSLANAQNQTTVLRDSIGKVKVTVKTGKSTKADTKNTAVTVVGIDTSDSDSTNTTSDSTYVSHGKASFSFDTDDSDFPFHNFGDAVGGGIIVAIIAIICIFGLPIFVIFFIFFFRYKNRRARYRLAEQALAAGQPLPEGLIKEYQSMDQRSQGIKNTFTGIGLFIFLWAITDSFGLGAIGLLVMFMGLGQWLIGYQREKKASENPVEGKKSEDSNKEKNEEKE